MGKWQPQYPINTNAGGDTVYDGFVKASAELQAIYNRLNDLRVVRASPSPPSDAEQYELWLDTSSTPPRLKYFNGATWVHADELFPQGSGSGLDADMVDGFHASQSPAAGQIPVLNSIGQLQLPFHQDPILVGGQVYGYRVFYVDQLNGDDNNDGSQSAPFKTLTKGIASVPVGGVGIIYVIGDYNLDNESGDIFIYNKKIRIILKGTLSVSWKTVSNYALLRSTFALLKNSSIEFWIDSANNGKIVIADNNTGLSPAGVSTGLVRTVGNGEAVICSAGFYLRITADNYTPIEIGTDAFLMDARVWSSWDGFVVFCLTGHHPGTGREIIVRGKLLRLYSLTGTAVYKVAYDGGFKDGSGNAVGPATLITGVIKDGNGVPRNVVSNLIL